MVYLITYDLKTPGKDYSRLYDEIKSFGVFHHALESVWFVSTQLSSNIIRDKLRATMDSNDLIFLSRVTNDYSGYLNNETIRWLTTYVS